MFKLVRLLFAGALLIALIPSSSALAQTTYDPWTLPVNLSHSGVAVNPSIVIDSEGIVHAIWQDNLTNFIYSRLDGDQWRAPETTNLNDLFRMPEASEVARESPLALYTGPNPLFIAGHHKDIFAFWISSLGRLFTSKVRNVDFQHVASWNDERLITPGVAAFAVAVDESGELHLVYTRTVDEPGYPSGIYYTRSKYNAQHWSTPVLLYESTYFRRLGAGDANLSIATAGPGDALHVFVAWDNRPRKQVFLAQSNNGGISWEPSSVIAGPAPASGLAGPFNIHVNADKDSVVLFWQSGRPNGTCNQIYRFSNDAGATWSDPQLMLEDLLGCAKSNEFVTGSANNSDGSLYLLTETESQVFLTAWNGRQWSHPQDQPILADFEDPEIFTQIDYGCHRGSLLGERLYIVGCDQGGGGDVWVTSREVGSNASLFSPPVWSQPSPVTEDHLEIEAIELVASSDDLIHAFISQRQDPVIYYASWDGASWSHITPVLSLPDGEAGWPAVAAGPGNDLFLVARNNRGALYFSRATSGKAASESSWSAPTRLAIGHDGEIGSVDVTCDAAGTIYMAYSVPVNEERGVYLVQSKDQGTTWSEPVQVFNGAAASFDLVGAPSLLISESGVLHITWNQQSIQGVGVPQPISLYYTRSEDGGHTFKDAEPIIKEPVAWRDIVADDKGDLHLLWQPQGTIANVWDQISVDGGNSWQFPQGLPDEGKLAAVTRDAVGRLHWIGVSPGALDHWLWDGNRWQPEAPLRWFVTSPQAGPAELVAATVNKQGKMVVVLAMPTDTTDATQSTLLYSTRTLELPRNQTAIQEAPAQAQLPPTLSPVTPTPEPLSTPQGTPESEPVNSQGQLNPSETNNPITPYTMALLPVALLLLSVLGIVMRQATRAKDR